MDRKRAKWELMQIYGSLSSEKQMAIDTLLKDNIECEWARMVNDTEVTPRRIEFEFSGGTRKRVLYTEEVIKRDMRDKE